MNRARGGRRTRRRTSTRTVPMKRPICVHCSTRVEESRSPGGPDDIDPTIGGRNSEVGNRRFQSPQTAASERPDASDVPVPVDGRYAKVSDRRVSGLRSSGRRVECYSYLYVPRHATEPRNWMDRSTRAEEGRMRGRPDEIEPTTGDRTTGDPRSPQPSSVCLSRVDS